jgi:hypothetical protein
MKYLYEMQDAGSKKGTLPESGMSLYLFLILVVLFLPYLILCFFAHPVADDLSYSHKTMSLGLWPAMQHDYLHWNGRYFSNFLVMASPLCFDSLLLYRLCAFALILALPCAVYFFIRSLLREKLSKPQFVFASGLLSLLWLNLLPTIAQGIYWYTGAMTYVAGVILFLLYAGHLLRMINGSSAITGWRGIALLAILLFLSCGFNEVQTLIVLAITLVERASRKKNFWTSFNYLCRCRIDHDTCAG